MVLTSLFTAIVTTEVAAQSTASDVQFVTDFAGKRVCSTSGYWNSDPLIAKHGESFGAKVAGSSLADCIEQMIAGTADAVYYDRPPMEKMLLDKHVESAFLLTPTLAPLELTPVFPDAFNPRFGTPAMPQLRNEYNEQVLSLSVSGTLDGLYDYHFSPVPGGAGQALEPSLNVGQLMVLVAFSVLYVLLNLNARRVNRDHAHHEERKRRAAERAARRKMRRNSHRQSVGLAPDLSETKKHAWLKEYFDMSGFFAWDTRREDHQVTVDTKLNRLAEHVSKLTDVVARIHGKSGVSDGSASSVEAGRLGQRTKLDPIAKLRPYDSEGVKVLRRAERDV